MSIALTLNQAVSTTIAASFLPTVGRYGYSTDVLRASPAARSSTSSPLPSSCPRPRARPSRRSSSSSSGAGSPERPFLIERAPFGPKDRRVQSAPPNPCGRRALISRRGRPTPTPHNPHGRKHLQVRIRNHARRHRRRPLHADQRRRPGLQGHHLRRGRSPSSTSPTGPAGWATSSSALTTCPSTSRTARASAPWSGGSPTGSRRAGSSVDGKTYTLAINNAPNTLHGGIKGLRQGRLGGARPRSRPTVPRSSSATSAPTATRASRARSRVRMTYTLTNANELRIDYEATTDKATPVNLTNHSYFNLACKGDVLGQVLQLNAEQYTPADAGLIPTGAIAEVAGGPLDFTSAKPIGRDIGKLPGGMRGYDHNFVIDGGGRGLVLAARAYEPRFGPRARGADRPAGRPALHRQLASTAASWASTAWRIPLHAAFCLETQHYPDSVNKPGFPSTILRPGRDLPQHDDLPLLGEVTRPVRMRASQRPHPRGGDLQAPPRPSGSRPGCSARTNRSWSATSRQFAPAGDLADRRSVTSADVGLIANRRRSGPFDRSAFSTTASGAPPPLKNRKYPSRGAAEMAQEPAARAPSERDPVGEVGVRAQVAVQPPVVQGVDVAAPVGVAQAPLGPEEVLALRDHRDSDRHEQDGRPSGACAARRSASGGFRQSPGSR